VRERSLLHALALGYGPLLEKGRYPLAALFVELPGGEVDVNVHPQKLEVRFARAQEVYAAVRHVVAAAIAQAPWLETAGPPAPMRTYTQPPPAGWQPPTARERHAPSSRSAAEDRVLPLRVRDSAPDAEPAYAAQPAGAAAGGSAGVTASAPGFFTRLTYLGQAHRTYLVCEAPDEVILIDQHAAHERVAYARLRAAHARREVARQRLLFPIPIDVDETAASAAESGALLGALGFEVTRSGPRQVTVHAVPEALKDSDPKPLVRDVLAELAEGTPLDGGDLEHLDHLLATIACHSVVRAGDVLGRPEAIALLAQLDDVDLRSHCPHGRPVVLRLPLSEIERRFGRV
jgi:DNA mismatch repair protein MutL